MLYNRTIINKNTNIKYNDTIIVYYNINSKYIKISLFKIN
jgi:hypothetical protein